MILIPILHSYHLAIYTALLFTVLIAWPGITVTLLPLKQTQFELLKQPVNHTHGSYLCFSDLLN